MATIAPPLAETAAAAAPPATGRYVELKNEHGSNTVWLLVFSAATGKPIFDVRGSLYFQVTPMNKKLLDLKQYPYLQFDQKVYLGVGLRYNDDFLYDQTQQFHYNAYTINPVNGIYDENGQYKTLPIKNVTTNLLEPDPQVPVLAQLSVAPSVSSFNGASPVSAATTSLESLSLGAGSPSVAKLLASLATLITPDL